MIYKAILALLFIVLAGPAAADDCCRYKAVVLSCYDGDTCTATIKLGLGVSVVEKIRLARIDAPELRGPEREQGLSARFVLRDLVVGKEAVIETDHDKRGKYGRLIVELWVEGQNISDLMVAGRQAVYQDY